MSLAFWQFLWNARVCTKESPGRAGFFPAIVVCVCTSKAVLGPGQAFHPTSTAKSPEQRPNVSRHRLAVFNLTSNCWLPGPNVNGRLEELKRRGSQRPVRGSRPKSHRPPDPCTSRAENVEVPLGQANQVLVRQENLEEKNATAFSFFRVVYLCEYHLQLVQSPSMHCLPSHGPSGSQPSQDPSCECPPFYGPHWNADLLQHGSLCFLASRLVSAVLCLVFICYQDLDLASKGGV